MKTLIRDYLAIYLLLCAQITYGQAKRANCWTFQDSLGINFTDLQNPTVFISRVDGDGQSHEANATICDPNGNLLMYLYPGNTADFMQSYFVTGKIYDKNHQLILNGDSLNVDNSATNGGAFIPDPVDTNRYYLFTIGRKTPPAPWFIPSLALFVHTIQIINGVPVLIEKNKLLYFPPEVYPQPVPNLSEKIAAVRHANGRDWWIFTHDVTGPYRFVSFLLTAQGLQGPFIQQIGPNPTEPAPENNTGEMLFCLKGDKLAMSVFGPFYPASGAYLFDFDRCSGTLSNCKTLSPPQGRSLYACAFSPNGKIVYVNTTGNLYQINTESSNPWAEATFLFDIYNYFGDGQTRLSGQLELAPDGKIYMTHEFRNGTENHHLSVIHQPDSLGEACLFKPFDFYVGRNTSLGLPHMPNYNLGALYPDVIAQAGNDKFLCPGDSVQLGIKTNPEFSYQWMPATGLSDTTQAEPHAAPAITTTYILTVWNTQAGLCSAQFDTVTVYVTQFLTHFSTNIDNFNAHFSLNASNENLTYFWKFGDGDSSFLKSPAHIYPDTGNYIVTLTLTDTLSGCKKTLTDTLQINVSQKPEIYTSNTTSFNLYPNPANETVTVEHDFKNATLELIDVNGRVVHSHKAPKPKNVIDLRPFAKGIYYIRLVTNLNQILSVKKLILN